MCCVIGSPNLTNAALSRNVESCVLLDGSLDDSALTELSRFVAKAWQSAENISQESSIGTATSTQPRRLHDKN
ncbi:hypothetical protein D3C80_2021560 [compost metagenome]